MLRPYWKLPRLLIIKNPDNDFIDVSSKQDRSKIFDTSCLNNIFQVHNGLKFQNINLNTNFYINTKPIDFVFSKILGSKILISKRLKLKMKKREKKKKK